MALIKIIDDDVEIAENLALVLRNANHKVSEISDTTKDAVKSLLEDKPELLILDVMFPENPAAGFDLARKIRQTPGIENLPIILLTGVNQEFPMDFSSEDIDSDWMPVQDFVEKPANIDELLAKIEKLLEPTG